MGRNGTSHREEIGVIRDVINKDRAERSRRRKKERKGGEGGQ